MLLSRRFWFVFLLVLAVLLSLMAVTRGSNEAGVRAAADLLRGFASLAWPALAAAFIWYFKDNFRNLIDRTVKVGLSGAEFAAAALASQLVKKPIAEAAKDLSLDILDQQVVLGLAENLRHNLNIKHPHDPTARETELILSLANVRLVGSALGIYLRIFLSQLEVLEKMIEGPIEITQFHQSHIDRYNHLMPDRQNTAPPLNLATWTAFLSLNKLITLNGASGQLTSEGRAFIDFVMFQNLPRFQTL